MGSGATVGFLVVSFLPEYHDVCRWAVGGGRRAQGVSIGATPAVVLGMAPGHCAPRSSDNLPPAPTCLDVRMAPPALSCPDFTHDKPGLGIWAGWREGPAGFRKQSSHFLSFYQSQHLRIELCALMPDAVPGAKGGAAVFYGEHSWFPHRHICAPLSRGSPTLSSGRLRSRAPGLLLAQALGDPESSELPLMPHSALSSPLLYPRGGTPAPPWLPGPLASSLGGESGDFLPRGRRVPGIPPLPREVS